MSRIVSMLVVAALAAAAMVLPAPPAPSVGEVGAVDPAHVMVCPVEQGRGRNTTLSIVSDLAAPGRITLFAGGDVTGEASYETGASGSASVPVDEIGAVGTASALVELPTPSSAVSSLTGGDGPIALELCHSTPSLQTVVTGASTLSGQSADLFVMNPYSGRAQVEITVRSESGAEAAPGLASLSIPPRSVVPVDLNDVLPGREMLTFTVETVRGRVLVTARQAGSGDESVWNAVAPSEEWFIPMPALADAEVVLTSPLAAEAPYQLDVYGPDGLVEAASEGVIPAGGSVTIDRAEFPTDEPVAVRVISPQPIVAMLRTVGGDTVAATSGAALTANRWLFPGAGTTASGEGLMVVVNPSLDDATVEIASLRDESVAVEFQLPAGQVVELESIDGPGRGYLVQSSQGVVAMWTTLEGPARAYTVGLPFQDG